MPSDAPSSRAPTATGFGKVLCSVQGLQQRLDDFSIDEVSRAHAGAYTLIQRLDDLQRQLTALAKLKEAVTSANAQISAIPDQNFDLIGLEHHSQLRAIVQVGRLIRMRRSLQEAHASPGLSLLDLERMPSREDLAVKQTNDDISSEASQALSPVEFGTSPSVENAVEAPTEHAPSDAMIRNETGLAGDGAETLSTPASPTSAPASEASAAINLSIRLRSESYPPSTQPAAASRTPEDANSAVKANFDRRLLNDLIETYGEFTTATTATKSAAPATMIPPQPLEDSKTSVDLICLQTAPAKPALVRSAAGGLLALPAPERKSSEPSVPRMLPSLKKQGEIDRQLKRIVKDYGEYDLYSPRKSLSLKMAAIAAFAMLGLALGSFYFFKASPPEVPVAVEATPPAGIKEAPKAAR